MRAIADACAIIVFLSAPDASTRMPDAYPFMRSGEVFVSPLTVTEIARLIVLGRIPTIPGGVASYLRQQRFHPLAVTWDEAETAAGLPMIHKDPYDRMLVAHSLHHRLPILTNDGEIPKYGAQTVW